MIKHKDYYEVIIKRKNDQISFYIDISDYDIIKEYKWRALESKRTDIIYIRGRLKGKEPTLLLHRVLLSPNEKEKVDHINGNGLDNRRQNLRLTDYFGNNKNAKCRKDSKSSKYKGVQFVNNKWMARIQYNNKRIIIGRFNTEKEAAVEYNKAALMYHKEYARLNNVK